MNHPYSGIAAAFNKPAQMEILRFTNERGTTQRAAVLDHPNAEGTVYFYQGQSEFIESHYELATNLYNRNLSVRIYERAGEGGSDRLAENSQMPPSLSHNAHLADMDYFLHVVCPPPQGVPSIMLTNCIGGLYGLRYLHDYPGMFDHAIMGSPLFGKEVKNKRDLTTSFARMLARHDDAYVPGASDWNWASKMRRADNPPTTHNTDRYLNFQKWQHEHVALRTGGFTYGNLTATQQSLVAIREDGFAESILTPITIVTATDEVLSSVSDQIIMASRLPLGRQIMMEGARHNLFMEDDHWRNPLIDEVQKTVLLHASKPSPAKSPAMAYIPA